jgi:hypothetical protein
VIKDGHAYCDECAGDLKAHEGHLYGQKLLCGKCAHVLEAVLPEKTVEISCDLCGIAIEAPFRGHDRAGRLYCGECVKTYDRTVYKSASDYRLTRFLVSVITIVALLSFALAALALGIHLSSSPSDLDPAFIFAVLGTGVVFLSGVNALVLIEILRRL